MNSKSLFDIINCISLFKTIKFNFRAFPFKTAIKFPILVGKCVVIKKIGRVSIENSLSRIHLGTQQLFNTCNKLPLIWDNKGLVSFKGKVIIQPGVCIHTSTLGYLELGNNIYIGTGTLIVSQNHIVIGKNTQISWNCQLCDTDFHFIQNNSSRTIKNNCKPIDIGDSVWIGNHVMITKGIKIADNCIIGQCSFVNRSIDNPNTIAVGNPIRVLAGKYSRIWDSCLELELTEQFSKKDIPNIFVNL